MVLKPPFGLVPAGVHRDSLVVQDHNGTDQLHDARSATAPWQSSELFREKPAESPYGYVRQGQAVGCDEAGLLKAVSETGEKEVLLVWVPEFPRLLTVYEVPALEGALAERTRRSLRVQMTGSLMLLPLVGGIVLLVRKEPVQREFWMALLFLFVMAPVASTLFDLRRLRRQTAAFLQEQAQTLRFSFWQSHLKFWLSNRLLWVLVGLYIAQLVLGYENSVERAGLVKRSVRLGDWPRLITCAFLHASSPLHIWFNAMAWRSVGRVVESLAGWETLAPVFLVSILGGSLTSMWWQPTGSSIGASGGICGVIGCILALAMRYRTSLPRGLARSVWHSVGYTLAMGLMAPNVIDNAAHVGGLLAGFVFTHLWVPFKAGAVPLRSSGPRRLIGTVAIAILGAAAALTLIRMLQR